MSGAAAGDPRGLLHLNDGGSIINVSSIVSRMGIPAPPSMPAPRARWTPSPRFWPANWARVASGSTPSIPAWWRAKAPAAPAFIGGDFQKTIEADTPLGRIGQPEDIGKVAVFLAGDESGWLTGERISASGGNR